MQRANVTVRIAGLLTNTVPKMNVTPAEILVLQHIHGNEAVVDIRPTDFDKTVRQDAEYDRLASIYDEGAGAFGTTPGEDREPLMQRLFPGAIKRLPTTLEEIGIDTGAAAAQPEPVPVPDLPDAPEEEPEPEAETDTNAETAGE